MHNLSDCIIITCNEAKNIIELVDKLWEDAGEKEYGIGTFDIIHDLEEIVKEIRNG